MTPPSKPSIVLDTGGILRNSAAMPSAILTLAKASSRVRSRCAGRFERGPVCEKDAADEGGSTGHYVGAPKRKSTLRVVAQLPRKSQLQVIQVI